MHLASGSCSWHTSKWKIMNLLILKWLIPCAVLVCLLIIALAVLTLHVLGRGGGFMQVWTKASSFVFAGKLDGKYKNHKSSAVKVIFITAVLHTTVWQSSECDSGVSKVSVWLRWLFSDGGRNMSGQPECHLIPGWRSSVWNRRYSTCWWVKARDGHWKSQFRCTCTLWKQSHNICV